MKPIAENKPRLDPFAFAPETNGRFTTLIVAAVTLICVFSFYALGVSFLIFGINFNPIADIPDVRQVTEEILADDGDMLELTDAQLAVLAQNVRPILINSLVSTLRWVLPLLLLVILILGGAVVMYRTHPARIRWRHKLRRLPPNEDPKLDDVMQDLSAQAGLLSVPTIWTSKTDRANGQAFGRGNDHMLRLNRPKLLLHKYPDKFRALVGHELGHIANGDVWRSYFSRAVWRTFFALVLISIVMIVILIVLPNLEQIRLTSTLGRLLAQLMAMFLVVTAIWRGLLRSREFYADWRAASWGMGTTLEKILSQQAQQEKKATRWWPRIGSFHPSATERVNVLRDPTKLFQIARDLPFLSGLILAITIFGLPIMVGLLFIPLALFLEIVFSTVAPIVLSFPYPLSRLLYSLFIILFRLMPLLLPALAILLCIGYLMTSTLGVQVQRETIADLVHGVHRFRSYGRLWQSAILLTIGLQLGFLIMPVAYSFPTSPLEITLSLIWLITFSFLTWLWLAYIRMLTQLTMGSRVGYTYPKRAKWLVNTLSTVALAVLYPAAFLLLLTIQFVERSLPSAMMPVGNTPLEPSVFIGITIAILFTIALICFFAAMLSLIVLYGGLHLRPACKCPECDEETPHKIVVGQTCNACYSPLSPWIYADAHNN